MFASILAAAAVAATQPRLSPPEIRTAAAQSLTYVRVYPTAVDHWRQFAHDGATPLARLDAQRTAACEQQAAALNAASDLKKLAVRGDLVLFDEGLVHHVGSSVYTLDQDDLKVVELMRLEYEDRARHFGETCRGL